MHRILTNSGGYSDAPPPDLHQTLPSGIIPNSVWTWMPNGAGFPLRRLQFLVRRPYFQFSLEMNWNSLFYLPTYSRLPFYSNAIGGERENCELSDRSTRELDTSNPSFFETNGDYDFYERSQNSDCLDGNSLLFNYRIIIIINSNECIVFRSFHCSLVSQTCNEDGMEFTLRTPEGFTGRIYTYGFYDRCFFRGTGGLTNVLRITGPRGFPDCGSQRVSDSGKKCWV